MLHLARVWDEDEGREDRREDAIHTPPIGCGLGPGPLNIVCCVPDIRGREKSRLNGRLAPEGARGGSQAQVLTRGVVRSWWLEANCVANLGAVRDLDPSVFCSSYLDA